jgi:hypothetical protein
LRISQHGSTTFNNQQIVVTAPYNHLVEEDAILVDELVPVVILDVSGLADDGPIRLQLTNISTGGQVIAIGDNPVFNAGAVVRGFPLQPGDSVLIEPVFMNLSAIASIAGGSLARFAIQAT